MNNQQKTQALERLKDYKASLAIEGITLTGDEEALLISQIEAGLSLDQALQQIVTYCERTRFQSIAEPK